MAKPPKLLIEFAMSAYQPTWQTFGGTQYVAYLDPNNGIRVVMRSRDEWTEKGVDELRKLVPVSRRTMGPVWVLDGDGWRRL
jgi:hypothetical protein